MPPSAASEPGPLTEAAGLLTSGTIFPRRVGLRTTTQAPSPGAEAPAEILAGLQPGTLALYFGDDPICHFDRDGRWQRAFVAGVHYLKGLDTRVQAVSRPRVDDQMVLRRRVLTAPEVADLDAQIAHRARTLADALRLGQYDLLSPPLPAQPIVLPELLAALDRIAAWDAAAWSDHRLRYGRAFGAGPLPLLPPDCLRPLILRPGPDLRPSDLDPPIAALAALLGDRLHQCRDLYLAGSGWIHRPTVAVVQLIQALTARWAIKPEPARHPADDDSPARGPRLRLIYGSIEDARTVGNLGHDWAQIQAAGLHRVALAVDVDPRAWPAIPSLIQSLENAKIGLNLMLSLACAAEFRVMTAPTGLTLRRGDLVTLVADRTGDDGESAVLNGLADREKAQFQAILGKSGARVVVYHPEKQWL